jgi:ABC-2 type transport system ATP-binding protein
LTAVGRPADLVRPLRPDAILYGHLRRDVTAVCEQAVRQRLPAGVELEVTGRRVRLAAPDPESLGHGLAVALSEGLEFDSYRTPPVRLERLFRGPQPTPRRAACDAS